MTDQQYQEIMAEIAELKNMVAELQPKTRKASSGKPAIEIQTYLQQCKEQGVKPIPEDDAVFTYAEDHGIPQQFLHLCFLEFVERNRENRKRQKDWRQAFRNCVRGNWYRLWWMDNGEYKLTSAGQQAEQRLRKQ